MASRSMSKFESEKNVIRNMRKVSLFTHVIGFKYIPRNMVWGQHSTLGFENQNI
jgi:hypothetical protein